MKKTIPTYEKLPKAFKAKWVKALKSGDFKQGEGVLRSKDNCYCCLGVAAKISGATCITGPSYIEKGKNIRGISKIPPMLLGNEHTALPRKLADMNDYGDNFNTIADWIDKNL